METGTAAARPSSKIIWTGRIVSGIMVLFLVIGNTVAIIKHAEFASETARMGYAGLGIRISITCIVCALIYAFPRTSVLGAILLTGYLGGAVSTHVRLGEPFFFRYSLPCWPGAVYFCVMKSCALSFRCDIESARAGTKW